MQLYFSPLACSMASRIAFLEAGATPDYVQVDPRSKRTHDGADYRAIHPLALVPAIRTDDGVLITENAAVLQWIAERFPAAGLAPSTPLERARLQQWLCFIGTELHKGLFIPLFDPALGAEVKQHFLAKGRSRLDYLDAHLRDRRFVLDGFSVADAYLVTVQNWRIATPVDLGQWPAVQRYYRQMLERPSVARALAEESALYAAEQR